MCLWCWVLWCCYAANVFLCVSPWSCMLPATALAFMTIGEMVLLSSSDAAFTVSLNLGSSEFSISRFATSRIRLARRAMLVAPATSIWGWWLAMATWHLSRSFLMASSDAFSRDLVSIASSTRPERDRERVENNSKHSPYSDKHSDFNLVLLFFSTS